MAAGKLYKSSGGDEYITNVSYRLHDSSERSWWGELMLSEFKKVTDGTGYVLELDDGRKGPCMLRKRVNRAVSGVPPLYCYHFKGSGRLE